MNNGTVTVLIVSLKRDKDIYSKKASGWCIKCKMFIDLYNINDTFVDFI